MATKRRFSEIRDLILKNLYGNKKTVNQISSEAIINWKTVDNHLIYLVGKAMVQVVFSSPYVKIFELTELGKEYVEHLTGESKKKEEDK